MLEVRKKFKILERAVEITSGECASALREAFLQGKFQLLSSVNMNRWSSFPPDDFSQGRSLCTYRHCIDVELAESGVATITVFDGDGYSGVRKEPRAKYSLQGPWWEIPQLCEAVDSRFQTHTRRLLQEELDKELAVRQQAIGEALLAQAEL